MRRLALVAMFSSLGALAGACGDDRRPQDGAAPVEPGPVEGGAVDSRRDAPDAAVDRPDVPPTDVPLDVPPTDAPDGAVDARDMAGDGLADARDVPADLPIPPPDVALLDVPRLDVPADLPVLPPDGPVPPPDVWPDLPPDMGPDMAPPPLPTTCAFTTPAPGIVTLCAQDNLTTTCEKDGDGAAGWQGTLAVQVTVDGGPASSGTATFSIGGNQAGIINLSGGVAQLAADIADTNAVELRVDVDIAGAAPCTVTRTVLVDTVPPASPVTSLAATVPPALRRQVTFQLVWTQPGGVSSYDVRVQRASAGPLDDTTFAAAERVSYPGSLPMQVADRYPETDYNFAVRPLDAVGNFGPTAFAGPVQSPFNRTLLELPACIGNPACAATDRFGYATDGSASVDGDAFSDLLVTSFQANLTSSTNAPCAHLYFGGATGPAATPDVTFLGDTDYCANAAAFVGDVDFDGFQDVALGEYATNRVLVFRGRTRASWPATLHLNAADYVITAPPGYTGGYFGWAIARLGRFDGDAVDDFAIGASADNGARFVYVIRGKAGFSNITLPQVPETYTITGDPAEPTGFFGVALTGVGTGLVVSGYLEASGAGRVYAFGIGDVTGNTIPLPGAGAKRVQGAAGDGMGALLSPLGSLGGAAFGLGVRNIFAAGGGHALLYATNSAASPFGGTPTRVISSVAGTQGFGTVLFGGGFGGVTSASVSIIGSNAADVVIGASNEGAARRLYIVDGARLGSLPTMLDAATESDVTIAFPTGWRPLSAATNGLVRDINNDGHADFAIGEQAHNIPGRLLVFW